MKKKKIKAVIFDVDGVLLNTVPYHFDAWKKMFKAYGINLTFDYYLLKINGLPRITGIKNILPNVNEKELEALADKKQGFFKQSIADNPPGPLSGVIEFLNKLKDLNIKMVAASSSKNAPLLLEQSGIHAYFSAILSGADFTHPKPHPELFLKASRRIHVSADECAVIEDAFLGIQAAKNAGMKTIGLLTSKDTKIKEFADLTIDSLKNHNQIFDFILNE